MDNQPNGTVTISYPDGGIYRGEVLKGVVQGFGEMTGADGFGYKGVF